MSGLRSAHRFVHSRFKHPRGVWARRKANFLKNLVPWLADPKLPPAAADKWIDYFSRADQGLGAEVRAPAPAPVIACPLLCSIILSAIAPLIARPPAL